MPIDLGTTVMVTNRPSANFPPAGSIGKLVHIHEHDVATPYGVDFFRPGRPTPDGLLHNLNGRLTRQSGRYFAEEDLLPISGLPLRPVPVTCITDNLVGVRFTVGDTHPNLSLRNKTGVIVGVSINVMGDPASLHLRLDDFRDGNNARGMLHAYSVDGMEMSWAESGHLIVDPYWVIPVGMRVRVTHVLELGLRIEPTARPAGEAIVVVNRGMGRSFGLRVYGLAYGHRLNGELSEAPGEARHEGQWIERQYFEALPMTVDQLYGEMTTEWGIRRPELHRISRSTPMYNNREPGPEEGQPAAEVVEVALVPGAPRARPEDLVDAFLDGVAVGNGPVLRAPPIERTFTIPGDTQVILIDGIGADSTVGDVATVPRDYHRLSATGRMTLRMHRAGQVYAACPRDIAVWPEGNELPEGTRVSCLRRVGEDGPEEGDVGTVYAHTRPGRYDVTFDIRRPGMADRTVSMPVESLKLLTIPPDVAVDLRPVVPRERVLQARAWGGNEVDRRMKMPFGRNLEDDVGKIATIAHRTDTFRALGLSIGTQGRIVGIYEGRYTVDFFPLSLPGGHRGHGRGVGDASCYDCDPRYLTISDLTAADATFAKGDRVLLAMGGGSMPPIDTEGVVLGTRNGQVDVDFYPYRWKYGKQLSGGNPRSCASLMAYAIKKVEVAEVETLKPFYLIGVIDRKITPLEDHPTFETGDEAERYRKSIEGTLPYKVQVRKAAKPNPKWREREEARFKDGTYKPLPKGWDLTPIPDHFLHLSVKHPGQVAFTPTTDYGENDRQINTRPGAYVQKFYPHLDLKQVARYSALAACDGGLEIVHDGPEMARIYRLGASGAGPESCMKYDFVGEGHGGPKTPIHPIECYAAGDLALAYLRQDGAIVARCLIWPERRLFTRAYGDLAKIIAVLEAEGYTRGDFIGAKLLRVIFDVNGTRLWVCPYVDDSNSVQGNPGAMGVVDDGTHLIITKPEDGQSTNQANGYIRIERQYRLKENAGMVNCEHCGRGNDPDELYEVVVAARPGEPLQIQRWDRRCRDGGTYQCVLLRKHCAIDTMPFVNDGESSGGYVSLAGLERRGGYVCDVANRGFYTKPAITLADGRRVAPMTLKKSGYTCAGDGRPRLNRDQDGNQSYEMIGSQRYSLEYLAGHPEEADRLRKEEEERRKAVEAKIRDMKKNKENILSALSGNIGSSTSSSTQYVSNIQSIAASWPVYKVLDPNDGGGQ